MLQFPIESKKNHTGGNITPCSNQTPGQQEVISVLSKFNQTQTEKTSYNSTIGQIKNKTQISFGLNKGIESHDSASNKQTIQQSELSNFGGGVFQMPSSQLFLKTKSRYGIKNEGNHQ